MSLLPVVLVSLLQVIPFITVTRAAPLYTCYGTHLCQGVWKGKIFKDGSVFFFFFIRRPKSPPALNNLVHLVQDPGILLSSRIARDSVTVEALLLNLKAWTFQRLKVWTSAFGFVNLLEERIYYLIDTVSSNSSSGTIAMSYNISLNFSSILAKLPGSRFLTLLRKGGYESPIDTLHPAATAVDELLITESSLGVDTPVAAAIDKLTSTPGAWAFFASGYMLGLFLMVS